VSSQTPDAAADGPSLPAGVPELDEVAGEWMDAADLAHLPSLRNQWGQGHVNHDLSSLSWLAAPPYTFGYHTGVLRVDGATLPAQQFRWKPYGVERRHSADGLTVRTDTRMALSEDLLLWQIDVVNDTDAPLETTLTQDLFAMVAHTETGWGWLYDVPWTDGNHHDFMSIERIRATTRADGERRPYLLGPGARLLRLGKPRLPGIQRDADTEIMSLSYELPRHVSQDTVYPHRHGVHATVRRIRCRPADRRSAPAILDLPDEITIHPERETATAAFELRAGHVFELDLRIETPGQTGIVLTHGNHPDSLQLGLDAGRLWFGICGEKEYADREIETGRWHSVRFTLADDSVQMSLDDAVTATTGHWSLSARWKTLTAEAAVHIADSRSQARASYGFTSTPNSLATLGAGARASWRLRLKPGQGSRIGIVCAYGTDALETASKATESARDFTDVFAKTELGYRELWRSMFTPGNPHFSGHLPAFEAVDPGLAKSYYMGALLALYMRNTRASATEPVFLTGGPRLGPTATYFWDHTEWSRLYALLEPVGLRSWLLRALGSPYDRAFGFDTKNGGPLGNEYAASHYALFRLVEHYVCITGDFAFLDEQAGDRTVLGHLDRFAHGWTDKRDEATGGVLADFGADPWRLLECVPNYVNVVASLNAAYIGMMRSYAGLLRRRDRPDEAERAETEAAELAAALVAMALPDGTWQIRHPEATETIGHVLDFGLVAAYLHGDLTEPQRANMIRFVQDKLLAGSWMRALAPDDPAAPLANRPDHGAGGAFCAWPGVTAHGFAKLGRKDLAADLLRVLHASASGGLWGQAMEIIADESEPGEGNRVRVAEDGVSNRDSIAGVATAEAVVSGLFGFDPSFRARPDKPRQSGPIHVPEVGTLSNLNVGESNLNIGDRTA
jgi:hypothetical protein